MWLKTIAVWFVGTVDTISIDGLGFCSSDKTGPDVPLPVGQSEAGPFLPSVENRQSSTFSACVEKSAKWVARP